MIKSYAKYFCIMRKLKRKKNNKNKNHLNTLIYFIERICFFRVDKIDFSSFSE